MAQHQQQNNFLTKLTLYKHIIRTQKLILKPKCAKFVPKNVSKQTILEN